MTLTVYEPPAISADEPARADAVAASGALDLLGDASLDAVVEQVRRAMRTRMAAITILHQDWQYLIAASGLACGVDSRRTSFCGHAINADEPVFFVPDAQRDERFAGNPNVVEGLKLRFYAGARVVVGRVPIGMVCVFDPAPRETLTPGDRQILRAAAGRVSDRIRALG